MPTTYRQLISSIFVILFYSSHAASSGVTDFISLTYENDFFVGSDDGYTSGTGITYGKGPFSDFNGKLPDWMNYLSRDLYISTMEGKKRSFAHMFFQRIQTPEIIKEKELINDDLPYVGFISWQGTLYAWDNNISDRLSLFLGLVGPASLAEQSQKAIHRIIGTSEPAGWNNQINTEPVFKIEAQRLLTLFRTNYTSTQIDFLGFTQAGIGNLKSEVSLGVAIRWGNRLKSSLSTFTLLADRHVNPLSLIPGNNFYLYLGADAGYVFNDIIIDGNTFANSHSLPLENHQNKVTGGIVWSHDSFAYVFQLSSMQSGSSQIKDRDEFGAFSITYSY